MHAPDSIMTRGIPTGNLRPQLLHQVYTSLLHIDPVPACGPQAASLRAARESEAQLLDTIFSVPPSANPSGISSASSAPGASLLSDPLEHQGRAQVAALGQQLQRLQAIR